MLRLRRSLLFVPADRPRAIDKALSSAADGVILDLEDAVAAAARPAALAMLPAVLARPAGSLERLVRLPGCDAPALAMIAAFGAAGVWPDGFVLPKVEDAAAMVAAEACLADAPPGLCLFAMIETPRGLQRLAAIAATGGRLAGLIAGTNDLAAALRCATPPDRWPLLPHLAAILAAARAEGLVALDGVCNRLDDPGLIAQEAAQGAALGFDGKTLIHPAQIEATHAAFTPGAESVADAHALLEDWRAAVAEGRAVARHRGRMIEAMHADAAARVLAAAGNSI